MKGGEEQGGGAVMLARGTALESLSLASSLCCGEDEEREPREETNQLSPFSVLFCSPVASPPPLPRGIECGITNEIFACWMTSRGLHS